MQCSRPSVGIEDPKKRVPQPLSKDHLPITATGADKVTLVTMHEVTNVNRLAPKQILNFAKVGMTIVYGGNGSRN